jgi:hypothetical protein
MVRHPLRFVSDEDRQTYRKAMRKLALTYGAIILFGIALISIRGHAGQTGVAANEGAVSVAINRMHFRDGRVGP